VNIAKLPELVRKAHKLQFVASRSQVETKFSEHRLVAGRLAGETDIFGSGGCHYA
jgi:hypothetical protein